ncbi:hypothetical protein KAK06_08215 [Ideonella sp. 4Y11]|uniref:Uncharacterized protein n=1 Tax=Ideonella aquatica TaxID=2824119 RepID=A0A940YL02_9BURK|nr:hypothetical protein [Ideonella aquatica]MBQ0958942.1 hypothetical protein [Ideonella aquatica]
MPAPAAPSPAQAEVTRRLSAIVKRFNAIPDPYRTADMVAAAKRFMGEYKHCKALFDQGRFTDAAAFLDPMDAAVQALEDLQAALPQRIKEAQDQADQGKEIAGQLKSDTELKAARKNWKTVSEEDKIKALRKVVAAQSKCLGIPPPELVIEHIPPADGLVTNGYFSPADGKLHINMDPASSVQNFERAVDLAILENAHHWQAHLVRQLKAGALKPGDPNFEQAQMFAVNEIHPGGYITGQEDYAAYKKQPLEDHAWTTGPQTAKQIIKGL